MAAMMFPAIWPMVLLYDRMIKNKSNNEASSSKKGEAKSLSSLEWIIAKNKKR